MRRSSGLLTCCNQRSKYGTPVAQIASTSGGTLANVHFEDQLEDGAMHFDYRIKQGVVTKSNAVALMRSVGLDV